VEERALLLNQEMDFLLKAAPQVRVHGAPTAKATAISSGLAPSQMPVGIESSAEDNYFTDQVRFQAAASDKITGDQDAPLPEDDEALGFPIDGKAPKRE
jgi:hypothetical protein